MKDTELDRVFAAVRGADPAATAARIGEVLRDTYDQILDGQHTGRFEWTQLYKTEKTHFGTLVEINLRRAFNHLIGDGRVMDYLIDGIEVDCKFSQTQFAWMIPMEARGQICLVVWAEDTSDPHWSMGLVRPTDELLGPKNQDQKARLNDDGKNAIRWLFQNEPLPPNVFLQLGPAKVKDIFEKTSGQQRVVRLFTHAIGRVVGRGAVATAAQQDDFLKRVRANGGARSLLQPSGIVIFGHEHHDLVQHLGLPVPAKGEFVSAKLVEVPQNSRRTKVLIRGKYWAIAEPGEATAAGPKLPRAPSAR